LYSFRIKSNTEVTILFEISNIRTALQISISWPVPYWWQ